MFHCISFMFITLQYNQCNNIHQRERVMLKVPVQPTNRDKKYEANTLNKAVLYYINV